MEVLAVAVAAWVILGMLGVGIIVSKSGWPKGPVGAQAVVVSAFILFGLFTVLMGLAVPRSRDDAPPDP